MAESKQLSLAEPEPPSRQESGKESPRAEPVTSPMDTATEDTAGKGRDKGSPSPSPAAPVPSEDADSEKEKVEAKEEVKEEEEEEEEEVKEKGKGEVIEEVIEEEVKEEAKEKAKEEVKVEEKEEAKEETKEKVKEKEESKVDAKEEASTEDDSTATSKPDEESPVVVVEQEEEVKTDPAVEAPPQSGVESSEPVAPEKEVPIEVAAEVVASEREEAEAKETVAPVTMMKMQQQNDDVAESAMEGEPKAAAAAAAEAATAAVVELAVGESRKRSQGDHSRRSRSSSSGSSSTSSNGGSNSLSEEASSGGSTGSAGSNSNSDSEGVSSAKKVKLETVVEQQEQLEEPPLEQQPKMVDAEPTAAVEVVLEEKKASECEKSSDECPAANDGDVAVEEKSTPEEKSMEVETSERKEEDEENAANGSPAPPPTEPVAVECKSPPCAQEEPPKAEPKGEEEKPTETLLLPPPPPPPPAQPVTSRVPAGGKASIVAPVLERPDSARLTADLQSCQRQLAEVRSKYDVTRKELHATKRKLKRMSVRLGNMTTGGGGGAAASGGIVGGAASPHALAGGPADDDRNRKWREPMIVAAMKIKNAMGIQAYKSLIKDGELLLPSLRTITRYLESLRKAGGGAAAAAAVALASAGTAKPNAPMEVDELPEDEEDEDVEEEDDDVVAVRADGLVNRRPEPTGMVKRKQPKTNGAPRTVDHNRNEQRRHPAAYPAGAAQQQRHHHHHHGPEVQDIKTEQDPVSFTASPDINYYQHNADEDEDEDEDGYRDPTSLLEGCRYEDVSGMQLNGEDGTGYHYAQQGQQQQQQQTLSQAQIEFLKSMVGFRKKWTPYELRTCNDIRRIIGSREYESLRRKDGMPLPSVKTLRKYRQAAQLPDTVDVMGRKRKHNELEDSPTNQSRAVSRHSAGGESGSADHGENGSGVLFPFGNDIDKEQLKPEQDPDGGHFDVSLLTIPQINFLQTLTMNTKGFSDYELQRSLELKNELGSGNYETLRKQEFLNIPTLAMLTRYEQDNGLEDLSRLVNGRRTAGGGGGGGSDRKRRKEAEAALELARDQEEQRNREIEEQRAREQQQQQEQEQEQQRQLELYNRLTQADPSRHPLFDSIAGDASPTDGADPAAAAAAIAAAMAAAAAAGLHPSQLEHLNGGVGGGGGTVGGEDSSLSMFEHHSIFDKDTPMFDMTKLSPAHVEFLNTLPENPKRWTQEMINSALDIKNEIGTRDYEILRRQGIPLPAARTLRRHKDIRNKADRAMSETGEILPASGPVTTPAGVVGGSG